MPRVPGSGERRGEVEGLAWRSSRERGPARRRGGRATGARGRHGCYTTPPPHHRRDWREAAGAVPCSSPWPRLKCKPRGRGASAHARGGLAGGRRCSRAPTRRTGPRIRPPARALLALTATAAAAEPVGELGSPLGRPNRGTRSLAADGEGPGARMCDSPGF